jgi:uncharacterized protein (DUF2345 family)
VDKRIIRSRSGHTITLDDTDGGGKISIVDKTGKNSIDIDSQKNALAVKAKDKIEINTEGGHKILVDGSAGQDKIEIVDKTGSNSVKINSMQNSITIESAMQLKLKAKTVEIEGTMTTVKGTGVLTLQGGVVKIN